MPEHLLECLGPFVCKAIRELLCFLCVWNSPAPHLGFGCFARGIGLYHRTILSLVLKWPFQKWGEKGKALLVSHLDQHQPSIVPAPITLRIIAHPPFRIIQYLTTEGIVTCETSKLVEEVVRCNIIGPGRGHRALKGQCVFIGGASRDSLDAAEFCESVDSVSVQRFDELGRALLG